MARAPKRRPLEWASRSLARGSSKNESWSEVYDRRDVWVGLKPTARLRASRSGQGLEERQLRKRKTKTLLSERRSLPKKCLTGPTLLQMSGYPTNHEVAAWPRTDR